MGNGKTVPIVALLGLATCFASVPAYAVPPPFEATITITGDLDIETGETTTLTSEWTTNKDVTRCEWSVDGVGEGEVSISGSSGSEQFAFTPASAGDYEITFRIWHHTQTDRDASESVTVTVTDPAPPDPDVWKNHGQYVKSVAQETPSGPGKGQIVSEAAKSSIGKPSK